MRTSMLPIGPALVFALAACNRTPEPPAGENAPTTASSAAPVPEAVTSASPPPTAIVYDCGDLQLTGSVGADNIDLSFSDGRTIALPRVPSGSGARYADTQGNQFFGKGPEAVLTQPGEPDRTCTASELGTSPAAGSAPGHAFRARGNEPGWMAEVRLGNRPSLHAEVDYGNRKLDVAEAAEDAGGWSGTTPDGTEVRLRLEQGDCQDDMSGEAFEARAILTVGGKDYRGCGGFEGG